jgi:hypothetical protein
LMPMARRRVTFDDSKNETQLVASRSELDLGYLFYTWNEFQVMRADARAEAQGRLIVDSVRTPNNGPSPSAKAIDVDVMKKPSASTQKKTAGLITGRQTQVMTAVELAG